MKTWRIAKSSGNRSCRISKPVLLLSAGFLLLLLDGCSRAQEATLSTEADGAVRVGSSLKVRSWPDELALYDSKDALAAEGLYYASWTAGESSEFVNEDGDTVDLFPAQATVLCAERKDPRSAQSDIEIWKSASSDNYAISETRSETIAGQEYEIITYTMKSPDSPWHGGVSAFAARSRSAVCAELTYQETFTGDPDQLLTGLLAGFSYQDQSRDQNP